MSSSSDLDSDIAEQIVAKTSNEKKKAKKSAPVAQGQARNEGDDPHWAYEPPKDAQLLDHAVDAGALEWDAVDGDEETEIWFIRVPNTIKPKHLEGLEIDSPSSRTACIGRMTKKHASYDIWSIGDDDPDEVCAEELRGLACLLPRKRKDGKLYIAPKRPSRHIVVCAQPPIPTVPDHPPVYQNPPRPSYAKDLLKHVFVPYGARARSEQTQPVDSSDNDIEIVEITPGKPHDKAPSPHKDRSAKSKSESKGKKRKGDGDAPKSSKKHKANT